MLRDTVASDAGGFGDGRAATFRPNDNGVGFFRGACDVERTSWRP